MRLDSRKIELVLAHKAHVECTRLGDEVAMDVDAHAVSTILQFPLTTMDNYGIDRSLITWLTV